MDTYNKLLNLRDDNSNIPNSILNKLDTNLHNKNNHPLCIIKNKIFNYFKNLDNDVLLLDNLNPIVNIKDNFDNLLIPLNHPSRSKSDTYYINENNILRTHMTVHTPQLLQNNNLVCDKTKSPQLLNLQKNNNSQNNQFAILCGDVYRKDEIDRNHYPIFHQLEGYKILRCDNKLDAVNEMKKILEELSKYLFGNDIEFKWNDDYFPFTTNSLEMEIKYNNKLLEILGCGILQDIIVESYGINSQEYKVLAFGMGLERLAMIYYEIPDIRLFWDNDERFINQFKNQLNENDNKIKFKEYSNHPVCYKDVSFWLNNNTNGDKLFIENDFYERVREICDDYIESIELKDKFTHPKTNRISMCYRINYRHMNKTLTNNEVNDIHNNIIELLENMDCEIRTGIKL